MSAGGRRLERSRAWRPALALGTTFAVVAGAALLLLVLPRPTHDQLVVTRTARWLIRYRLASSTERLGGHALSGRCLSSWFRLAGERGRGDLLVLGGTMVLLDVRPGRRRLHRVRLAPTVARRLDLAGCPRRLAALVDDRLQTYSGRFVTHASFHGRPVLALQLRRRPYELVLYVSPRDGYPLGLRSGTAESTIRLVRLTPSVLATMRSSLASSSSAARGGRALGLTRPRSG